ncbi:MAG: type IV pilus biogenesis/stability protein PilW [Legionellaceae bacterium]|nr:type IV pilus biogenesis/stability protein PilW [Legionellaceae bacterium]
MKTHYVVIIAICLALQSCQHAQDVKHDEEAALYNTQLGLAYLSQGDRSLAKRKLLMALAQAPNLPSANASMAYFMEKTGDMVKTEYYYRRAMLFAPGRGAQLNNYGAFLCRQGRYQQAERYFLLAVQDVQYDHTAAAYENAGLCVKAIPDDKKAVTYFQNALMQDPLRKQSLYELVRIELKQGQVAAATRHLQNYSSLVSHDPILTELAHSVAYKRVHTGVN